MPRKKNEGARYRLDPRYIEVRSERISLLIQPSLKSEARAAAAVLGVSLNEFVHRALAEKVQTVFSDDNADEGVDDENGAKGRNST